MKTVYKVVVTGEDGRYRSWNRPAYLGDLNVKYEIGKRSTALLGRLFVFNALTDAKKFVYDYSGVPSIILKCKTTNKPRVVRTVPFDHSDWFRFWGGEELEPCDVLDAPRGTFTVRSLTPIEVL